MLAPGWSARLTGIGFSLGVLEHVAGLALLAFDIEMYAGYPAWRHAVFTVADGTIAWIAFRRPGWLLPALSIFLAEQAATNGVKAWREWQASGRVLWAVVAIHTLVAGAILAAIVRRQRIKRPS